MAGDPLPYVAKSPWFVRLLFLPALAVIVAALWPPDTIFTLWEESSWVFRVCMVAAFTGIPLGGLEVFFKKTIFNSEGIVHRSLIGVKTFKQYSDIKEVIYGTDSLRIYFLDASKIRIWSGTADLYKVMHVIRKQAGTPIPMKYSHKL